MDDVSAILDQLTGWTVQRVTLAAAQTLSHDAISEHDVLTRTHE
jgi:hypothetical protein